MIGEGSVGVSLVWRFEVMVDGHCWVSLGVVVHGWVKSGVAVECWEEEEGEVRVD